MGGHGVHIHGNHHNIKEDDATFASKIREIETIKHNPSMFANDAFCACTWYEIVGGFKTLAFAAIGGGVALSYFLGAQRTRPYNFYVTLHQGFYRFVLGSAVGGAFGYHKFGDRQRLHNWYVAERLRRRYPESKALNTHDMWQYKRVEASHEFYRWR